MLFNLRARIPHLMPFLLSVLVAACGGGGGGSGAPAPADDTTPPRVTAVSVDNGAENVNVAAVLQVTFSEAVRNLDNTTFSLEAGGTPVNGAVIPNGTTGIFRPSANLYPYTTYTATVSTGVTDMSNNRLATDYRWSFTTGSPPDTTPPRVSATSPPDGQPGVPINMIVTATFSEPVSNVNARTFRLEVGGTPVIGTVIPNGTTATFTPYANLAVLTTYTATLTTAVTDPAGNPLAAEYSWSFTTGEAPDTTPPAISATTPAGGQTGVAVSARVQVAFDEAVKNLGAATFRLKDGAGAAVPGVVTAGGSTATFTPSSNLAYGATYTATVTSGVTDLAGNALAADNSWSFTTADAPGTCISCHGGIDGSQPGVNGAPVITRYWQTSGHGKSVSPLQCTDCHDVGTPAGTHAADGTGSLNTLGWPGKPSDTANANTAHLNNFFFAVPPAAAADHAAAFDDACNKRVGCHARAGGGWIARPMTHAKWYPDDPDYLIEFGTRGTPADPKSYSWYSQTTYASDFYKSQSPWTIADLTTDATAPPHYGTCVSCHDPHGTGATDNAGTIDSGRNAMVRGNWKTGYPFCTGACHLP